MVRVLGQNTLPVFFYLSVTQTSLCLTPEHHNGSPKSRGSRLSVLSSHGLLIDVDLKFGNKIRLVSEIIGFSHSLMFSLWFVDLLTDVTQYGNIL